MKSKTTKDRILQQHEERKKQITGRFTMGRHISRVVMMGLLLLGIACEDELFLNEPQEAPTDFADATEISSTPEASLPHTNIAELEMPVMVAYELTAYDCSNNPGPQITFSGFATTAGFGVRTIFRNNMEGTHEHVEETNVDVTLLPDGSEIMIPKQPVLGGTGGNPFIWIQFMNEQGNPISDEIFIGRCVQGFSFKGAQQVAENAISSSMYTVEGCENSPGPNITFDAGLSLAALNARIIFRNNDNPAGGPHEAIVAISDDLSVIPAGTSLTFPKQPVLGGVGGNPWIWTEFMNGSDSALSNEILLDVASNSAKPYRFGIGFDHRRYSSLQGIQRIMQELI